MTKDRKRVFTGLRKRLKKWGQSADNAVRWMREEKHHDAYSAPFTHVLESGILKLRHYTPHSSAQKVRISQPLLLIPPLMVTAEIYDISPELSAIQTLLDQGVDVWLSDFGAPEKEEGWDRTLDDHILAIDQAIDWIAQQTGEHVHLAGYSQGGMFAYQVAAFRKNRDIVSIITFGSPVDLHRNLPIHDSLAEKIFSATRYALKGTLDDLKGIPGIINSYGFKLVSPRQELKHLLKMMDAMHDEETMRRLMPKRRFLGGEGFIAWPGPAFRKFIDEYIIHNRLLHGGFVIDGLSASLTDLQVPILYFVGERDDLARPASVRAIRRAISNQANRDVHEVAIAAGHFGLVVGSKAMDEVWPRVIRWMQSYADDQKAPDLALPSLQEQHPHTSDSSHILRPLYQRTTDWLGEVLQRVEDRSLQMSQMLHTLRWQLPRMAHIMRIHEKERLSMSRVLRKQAESIPDVPFFLWLDRVHTYKEANDRVNQMVAQLAPHGFHKGQRVGIWMAPHPGYLLAIAALNRLGAVAVLFPPELNSDERKKAIQACGIEACITELGFYDQIKEEMHDRTCAILLEAQQNKSFPTGCIPIDLNRMDLPIPHNRVLDDGRAEDVAMILFTAGRSGSRKAVEVTHHRWGVAALTSASSCTITPKDTIYCSVPLHRSVGILLAVGGALMGGARILLRSSLSEGGFWHDTRRLGATIAFYNGQTLKELTGPSKTSEVHSSLRILAGNGMSEETWKRVHEQIPETQLIEFYGSTDSSVVLINLDGTKVGSVGRPIFDGELLAIVRCDPETQKPIRADNGRCIPCTIDETGLLLTRIDQKKPTLPFASYVHDQHMGQDVLQDVFIEGDRWFNTQDCMRKDQDGDYWLQTHPSRTP